MNISLSNNKTIQTLLFVMLSVLLYLPSCAFIPIRIYFVLIPIVLIYFSDEIKDRLKSRTILQTKSYSRNFILVLIISFFALINRLFHLESLTFGDFFSSFFFFPILYLVVKLIDKNIFYRTFLVLVLIEIAFGIGQYFSGVNTFFTGLDTYTQFGSYELLYYTRVLGLSNNSPIFALKIFFGILILTQLKLKKQVKLILSILLFVGIIITFNRSVILGLGFYLVILLLTYYRIKNYKKLKNQLILLTSSLLISILFYKDLRKQFLRMSSQSIELSESYIEKLSDKEVVYILDSLTKNFDYDEQIEFSKQQDLRERLKDVVFENKKKSALSGRSQIWERYFSFIKTNFWFGNGSKKLIDPYSYHPHNSFLYLLSSHGILISILILFFIFKNVSINNAYLILPILFISIVQSLIFWGASLFDILFYIFLISPNNVKTNEPS